MKIANWDSEERVLIVAEIGNNHEGDGGVARELIARAAEAGVDAVKFQTFQTEHYVSRDDADRFARLQSFALKPGDLSALAAHARQRGLMFFSTPLDLGSVATLEPLVDAFKIASADVTFYPLLTSVAATGKPMLVSTGVSDSQAVVETVRFLRSVWRVRHHVGQLAMLHCVTSYPVPADEANLAAIPYLRTILDCPVGYSDHTLGIEAAYAAVAAGARIVEKHFTLDHHYSDFRDHRLSADPPELTELVKRIRALEPMLGSFSKAVMPSAKKLVPAVLRSVVTRTALPAGHVVKRNDLTWVRPSGGLKPGEEAVVVGKRLRKAVPAGARLLASDVAAVPVRVHEHSPAHH